MPDSASDPELCLASSEANITGGEFSVTPVSPRSRRLRPPTRSRRCAWLLVLSVFCPPVVAQEPVPAELQQFTEQLMQQEQAELAANDKIGGKWRGVSRIRGTATIIYRTTVEEADLMPSDVRSMNDETTVRFEMARDDTHGEAGLQWRAHTISLVGGISEQSAFKTADELGEAVAAPLSAETPASGQAVAAEPAAQAAPVPAASTAMPSAPPRGPRAHPTCPAPTTIPMPGVRPRVTAAATGSN